MKNTDEIDAVIQVYFLTKDEGGRATSLCGKKYKYNCPMIINNKAFDCRFMVDPFCFKLGKKYEVPIRFLDKKEAKKNIKDGDEMYLWEGGKIGFGKIFWYKKK